MLTKSQINKVGKSIRVAQRSGIIIPKDLTDQLQEYRISYKPDISETFTKLSSISKKIRKDSIVSFRIKRIESIISKIKREPTMALANMGDIAGCRCIVRTWDSVVNTVNIIKSNFIVLQENDYLHKPKPDGYKGYHLYVQSPINKDRIIEIQIRSLECHNWSTLVEIIDILFDLKIKEGEVEEDFNRLLLLMSKKKKLSIKEKKEVIEIDRKRDIYSKLNETFLSNYIPIRRKWVELVEPNNHTFFIIEVDEKKESSIMSFTDYTTAEKTYYEKFNNNIRSNFVLTHVDKATFKNLCIAYSNYILIKHEYLSDWNKIVEDVMKFNIESGNKKEFEYYYDYVERNITHSSDQIGKELDELNAIFKEHDQDKDYQLFPTYGIDEWLNELKEIMVQRDNFLNKLEKMKEKLPSRLWQFLKLKKNK